MKFFKGLILVIVMFGIIGCEKQWTETSLKEAEPFYTAGTNQYDVEDFQVKLNADSLRAGQHGEWSIESGLVEERVYFSHKNSPDSRFNGMPGETYRLKWTVNSQVKQTLSESYVNVKFKSLRAVINNLSPENNTKFYLEANKYDRGEWTIDGKYAKFESQIHGGTVHEAINSPFVEFQGYRHKNYKLIWTTWYGSKSASDTLEINTGDYLEDEALIDLRMSRSSRLVKVENRRVVGLDLNANGIAWIFADTSKYPALQALINLKRLNLNGSAIGIFPEIFGAKYLDLEHLTIESTGIRNIASNIGNLKKLKHLVVSYAQYEQIKTLPESFGGLESLEYLDLSATGLERIPENFSQLTKLKYFRYQHNPVHKLPTEIGNLTKLEYLGGSTQQDLPRSFSKLKSLRRLLLFNHAPNPKFPEDIGNLTALDTIHLEGAYKELPASFSNLKNLRHLQFTTPPLISIPEDFGNLSKLVFLQIGGQMRTLPESLSKLTNLETLITGGSLEYFPTRIGELKKLSTLICEYGVLKELPESFGGLESLADLRLTGNHIETLPASFFDLPKVSRVWLHNNRIAHFSDDFIKMRGIIKQLTVQGNPYSPQEYAKLQTMLPGIGLY